VPGEPVGEQQDVPAFLLHHRLERLDQLGREDPGAMRHREQAEGEEAVDAFGKPGDQVGPFRVARLDVGRLRGELDVVRLHQLRQHLLVAVLLPSVARDGVAHLRVADGRGIGGHPHPRLAFGLHGDVPDRQGDDALQRLGVQIRPVDHRRLVRIERVLEHRTDGMLVRLAARHQAALMRAAPVPGDAVGLADGAGIDAARREGDGIGGFHGSGILWGWRSWRRSAVMGAG
jgi:hypothetical protein